MEPTSCACRHFATPLRTAEEVLQRYRVSRSITPTLDRLAATGDEGGLRLYRCRVCGQFWQESFDGARRDALYPVADIGVDEWVTRPYPDQALIAWWRGHLDSFGPEAGPEFCREGGCRRLRARLSIFCAKHHLTRNLHMPLPDPDVMPREYQD